MVDDIVGRLQHSSVMQSWPSISFCMKIQHDTTPLLGFVSLDICMDSRMRFGLNALVGPTSHFSGLVISDCDGVAHGNWEVRL